MTSPVSMATNPDQLRISLIHFDKSGAWGKMQYEVYGNYGKRHIQHQISGKIEQEACRPR